MNRKLALAMSAVLFVLTAAAQTQTSTNPDTARWLGIWQGQLDGQPGVIVTLGDDSGQLGGTVVFNLVSREGGTPHVIGSDAHVLTHISTQGDTLAFQVTRKKDAREIHVTMRLTAANSAELHCIDCGPDAPIAELTRAQ